MTKILIALSLVLPLITPISTSGFSPHNRYCVAIGWQEATKLVGEILEDDPNLLLSSLVKNLHFLTDIAAMVTRSCCFDSNSQSTLNKKSLALFKLNRVFLI
jgi:hypothetical protein